MLYRCHTVKIAFVLVNFNLISPENGQFCPLGQSNKYKYKIFELGVIFQSSNLKRTSNLKIIKEDQSKFFFCLAPRGSCISWFASYLIIWRPISCLRLVEPLTSSSLASVLWTFIADYFDYYSLLNGGKGSCPAWGRAHCTRTL